MTSNDSLVLPTTCLDDDCGMVSAIRYWKDGSFLTIFSACWHAKHYRRSAFIEQEFLKEAHP